MTIEYKDYISEYKDYKVKKRAEKSRENDALYMCEERSQTY